MSMNEGGRYIILHDIRSVWNVGSIFRTADAAGVAKIFCTGYTPTPVDRFGRSRTDFAKVALGAERAVAWEAGSLEVIIDTLKNDQVRIVAVEQDPKAKIYTAYVTEGPTAFMFGNEPDGLSEDVRSLSDAIVEIPMSGAKESLNVSVAAGIILFHFR